MRTTGTILYLIALIIGSAFGAFVFTDMFYPLFFSASLKHPLVAECAQWIVFGLLFLCGLFVPRRAPGSGIISFFVLCVVGLILLGLHFLA